MFFIPLSSNQNISPIIKSFYSLKSVLKKKKDIHINLTTNYKDPILKKERQRKRVPPNPHYIDRLPSGPTLLSQSVLSSFNKPLLCLPHPQKTSRDGKYILHHSFSNLRVILVGYVIDLVGQD